ncbi:MAG: hypothetical protein ACOYIB_08080 [Desulfosporosinus sp.]|jgi:hypothetical protein
MDDNKILEMFAQLLQGQTELRQGQEELRQGLEELRQDMVRMENKFTEKISGLYDFVSYQKEVNKDLAESIVRIEKKVDVLQMETAHLRRVK